MENLPFYIPLVFILTTLLAVLLFYKATRRSSLTLVVIGIWLIGQALLAGKGFYAVTDIRPPRLIFLLLPPLIAIALLFGTKKGRSYIDSLDPGLLTLVHIVRIPVEMVLFWLFLYKTVPRLLTFEGSNFDIFSGLTAPLIFYFGFVRKKLRKGIIITWNFICLGLLINVVAHAILSAPLPFQSFAFNQPNKAILYFPYNWLTACIVPLVLLSHLATLRALWKKTGNHSLQGSPQKAKPGMNIPGKESTLI